MFDIFQMDFFQRAVVAGLLVGLIAPLLGIFLVVRRYSLFADTLSHVSLVGVAASLLLQVNPLFGSLSATILAALGIERLRASGSFFGDSVLALFLSGSLALALVLFGLSPGSTSGMATYLFGSVTSVSRSDMWLIEACSCLVVFSVVLLFKTFFLLAYDEDIARTQGVRVQVLSGWLTVMTAVVVCLSMRIVGSLLVGALMVIPVMAAIRLGRGFLATALISILLSVTCVLVGLCLSAFVDIPSGAAIVLMAVGCFAGVFVWSKRTVFSQTGFFSRAVSKSR